MKAYTKPNCETIKIDIENELMATSTFNDEVGDKEQLSPMYPYRALEEEDNEL